MKKYVWSAMDVEGGKPFTGSLSHPPSSTGAFQSIGVRDMLAAPDGAPPPPQFYADSVIIGYKRPASDLPLESLHPKITASAGKPDAAMLSDGNFSKTTGLPIPADGESAWIQYNFAEPVTIRSITFVTKDPDFISAMVAGISAPDKALEASDDGRNFRSIVKLTGDGFDYINADGLIHELSVTEGRIKTPSGMTYRLLGLDPYSRHMSLPVLRAIRKLVEDGAVVAGPKPTDDPSLADEQGKFNQLSDELFGDGTGMHKMGKGTVYAGQSLGEVFNALQVARDFDYTKPESDTRLLIVHRKLTDGDPLFRRQSQRSRGAVGYHLPSNRQNS